MVILSKKNACFCLLMFNVFSNPENIWEINRLDCTVPLFFPKVLSVVEWALGQESRDFFFPPLTNHHHRPPQPSQFRPNQVMSMSTCAHKPTGVHPDATSTDPTTPGLSKECWSNAFSTLDRDGDGVITANDLNGQSRSKGEGAFFFWKKKQGKKHRFLWEKNMAKTKNKNGLKKTRWVVCLACEVVKGRFFNGVFNQKWPYWLIIWGAFLFRPIYGNPYACNSHGVLLYYLYYNKQLVNEKKIGGRFL